MCTLLALETEFIDWRRFLLSAAQPWPPASKMDLLLTLERCREVDTTLSGRLTHHEFEQVCLTAKVARGQTVLQIANVIVKSTKKQTASYERVFQKLSFEWSHYRLKSQNHPIHHNKQHLSSRFHLNGHTLGFHLQAQTLEPPCTA